MVSGYSDYLLGLFSIVVLLLVVDGTITNKKQDKADERLTTKSEHDRDKTAKILHTTQAAAGSHTEPTSPLNVSTPEPIVSPEEIREALSKFRVIPDVIPEGPPYRVDVWFGFETAEFGNVLHENMVQRQPVLCLWKWNPGEFYTLVATGPDVPEADLPLNGEWRHWMVINIPENKVEKGQILRDYEGFGAEYRPGYHRYVFLVFKQSKPFIKSEEAKLRYSDSRGFFSTRNFMKIHDLDMLMAANFVIVNCTNPIHDPNYTFPPNTTTSTVTTESFIDVTAEKHVTTKHVTTAHPTTTKKNAKETPNQHQGTTAKVHML